MYARKARRLLSMVVTGREKKDKDMYSLQGVVRVRLPKGWVAVRLTKVQISDQELLQVFESLE